MGGLAIRRRRIGRHVDCERMATRTDVAMPPVQIDDSNQAVLVVTIAHRREVYRGL